MKKSDNFTMKANVDYKIENPENPVVTGIQFCRARDANNQEKIIVRVCIRDINDSSNITWYPLGFLDDTLLYNLSIFLKCESNRLELSKDLMFSQFVRDLESGKFDDDDDE